MRAEGALRTVWSMLPRNRDDVPSSSPSQRLIPVAQLVASAEVSQQPASSWPLVVAGATDSATGSTAGVGAVGGAGGGGSGYDREIKRYAKLLTPFIYKLYSLVSDPSTNTLCEWTNAGNSFIVHDPVAFSANVLPLYFKHNQFSSFVRQLNKYSFHKLAPGAFIFGHPNFIQQRPDLLLRIGPPRPQDRPSAEKNRPASTPGGGASLSSLQRVNHHLQERGVHDVGRGRGRRDIGGVERIGEVVEGRRAEAGPVGFQRYEEEGIESVIARMMERHVEEVRSLQTMAKTEREALMRRVGIVERRSEEVWRRYEHLARELTEAQRRIQLLEGRKRGLEGEEEIHAKRRREDYGEG